MAWTTNKAETAIILRLEMDEAAQARINQNLSSFMQEYQRIEKEINDETAAKAAHENSLKRLKAEENAATRVQSSWRRMQFTARALGEVAQITAIATSAIFVGASAWATKYVNDAKASTETVRAWRVEVGHLGDTQTRVGAVLAGALLPLLTQAANLAEKGADFVEKNPELIQKALTITGAVAGLAAIGVAASKGFKIYADIGYTLATAKQVTAAGIYQAAATMSLEAANIDMASTTARITGVPVVAVGAAGAVGATVGVAGVAGAATATIAEGYRLNSAMRLINSATGRYVTLSQGMTVAAEGVLASLGGLATGLKGFVTNLPLYFFGTQKGVLSDEQTRKLEAGQARVTAAGGTWAFLKQSWIELGGWKGIFSGNRIVGATAAGTAPPATGSAEYLAVFAKEHRDLWTNNLKQITAATEAYGQQQVALETKYEQQRTSIVANYAKQQADSERQYAQQRAQAAAAFQKQQAQSAAAFALQQSRSEEQYQYDLSLAWRDYLQNETDTEQQYYETRLKSAADNSDELLKLEQEHQLEMNRMREDHDIAQQALLEARDGMAMIREDQRYELERSRAEEDYAIQVSRSNEQAAQTLRDADEQFARARALRQRDFQQQLADNAVAHARETAQARADHNRAMAQAARDYADAAALAAANHVAEMTQAALNYQEALKQAETDYYDQLKTLRDAYSIQMTAINDALMASVTAFDSSILNTTAAYQEGLAKQDAAFVAWMVAAVAAVQGAAGGPASKTPGSQAAGGYAYPGIYYQRGELGPEFLLSNRTTRLAENAIKGNLTQSNLADALFNGRYVDQRHIEFNGMTEENRVAIRGDMYEISREVLREAMSR